jgi:hypothetical protein
MLGRSRNADPRTPAGRSTAPPAPARNDRARIARRCRSSRRHARSADRRGRRPSPASRRAGSSRERCSSLAIHGECSTRACLRSRRNPTPPVRQSTASTNGALNWARCWPTASSPNYSAARSRSWRKTPRPMRLSAGASAYADDDCLSVGLCQAVPSARIASASLGPQLPRL